MRDPWDYLIEFRERLTALDAHPVVIGALAAGRFRDRPRQTTDVDFLVLSLDGVAAAMERDGFVVQAVAETGGQPYLMFIRGEDVQVDALLAETEYQLEAHRRATDGFLTVEDVIVHKLLAWRPRDRDDVESILAVGHLLDQQYIERWAADWEVLDRWREVDPLTG